MTSLPMPRVRSALQKPDSVLSPILWPGSGSFSNTRIRVGSSLLEKQGIDAADRTAPHHDHVVFFERGLRRGGQDCNHPRPGLSNRLEAMSIRDDRMGRRFSTGSIPIMSANRPINWRLPSHPVLRSCSQ